jgi:hypothetical protein
MIFRCSNTTTNLLQHVTINDFSYSHTMMLEQAVTCCNDGRGICDSLDNFFLTLEVIFSYFLRFFKNIEKSQCWLN